MTPLSQFLVNQFCPALGVIMANAVFAAPIKSLKSATVSASLGDLNPLPWTFMTGNCIGWVAYSFLIKNPYVLLANAPGVIVSLWLNSGAIKLQYYTQLRKRLDSSASKPEQGNDLSGVMAEHQQSLTKQERALYSILVVWITILSYVAFAPLDQEQKVLTIGIIVNLNLIVFFGAPLSSIATVLRLRDSSSIHRGTMVMSVLNCTFWLIYGLAVWDVFIYVPNGVGLILSLAQALLYLGCPRKDGLNFSVKVLDDDIEGIGAAADKDEEGTELSAFSGKKL